MDQGAGADTFARDNLPLAESWTVLLLAPPFDYPERLNCVAERLDAWVIRGDGARPCLTDGTVAWDDAALQDKVDRS